MRKGRLVTWVKKHETGLFLLTLVLTIVALPLTIVFFVYDDQQRTCDRILQESQNDANYRALVYRLNGGTADPVKIQECRYADQFQANLADSTHGTACVVVVVTRANGTVEGPSEPSC